MFLQNSKLLKKIHKVLTIFFAELLRGIGRSEVLSCDDRAAAKACVTNPTAAGRFLVTSGFTGLSLIFPHRTGAVHY
jgi:hypothetical protein